MKEVKVFAVTISPTIELRSVSEITREFIASDETEAILMGRMWYKQEWERDRGRMVTYGFTPSPDDKPEIHHCDVKYSRTVIVMEDGQ